MIIKLEKFGTTLVSRPSGKEAFLVIKKILKDLKENEIIEVDFEGVLTLTPGWADEVLTPLLDIYGDRLILKNTDNLSAKATIEMLQTISGKQFKISN
jgi:hypothetical protein